jgi:hypothetical protein
MPEVVAQFEAALETWTSTTGPFLEPVKELEKKKKPKKKKQKK